MLKPTYELGDFPPQAELETVPIIKALADANRVLGELKGRASSIPNQGILIDSLVLQEAKASSEIENIVTTQDELFKADWYQEDFDQTPVKEVARYGRSLRRGYDLMRQNQGIISNNMLKEMFQLLMLRNEGFRSAPGTTLKDELTGEVIYVPPQDANEIEALMGALEHFINDDDACALDPLIKMALIHHQFESIHPFSDGNGRIGRILNVLYLTRCNLLEIPILYMSRYINKTKSDYYRLLQQARHTDDPNQGWQEWVLYVLTAVASTAETTLGLVVGIRQQMSDLKLRLRSEFPSLYSQELLNNLFQHPYTRIEFVQRDLDVTRQTAAEYLNQLAGSGILEKQRTGKGNYYINTELVELFLSVSE